MRRGPQEFLMMHKNRALEKYVSGLLRQIPGYKASDQEFVSEIAAEFTMVFGKPLDDMVNIRNLRDRFRHAEELRQASNPTFHGCPVGELKMLDER